MVESKSVMLKRYSCAAADRIWRKRLNYLIPFVVFLWLIFTMISLPNIPKSRCFLEECKSNVLVSLTKGKSELEHSVDQSHIRACKIPKLRPFDDEVKPYFVAPEAVNCEDEFPLLFHSSVDHVVLPMKMPQEFRNLNITSCYYRALERGKNDTVPDEVFSLTEHYHPLSLKEETNVPKELEFIAILCTRVGVPKDLDKTWKVSNNSYMQVVDVHAFVPSKPQSFGGSEKVEEVIPSTDSNADRVNVLVLAIESVSRMSFIRTMPKSYHFLTRKMRAIDMKGYSVIGGDTFENLVPALMGMNSSTMETACGRGVLDNCPFIWKLFSEKGYKTCLVEDETKKALFNNGREGFQRPPTNYYPRPVWLALEYYLGNVIGKRHSKVCAGSRMGFEILLEYVRKFVTKMNSDTSPFFSFLRTSSLTQDNLNYPMLGDEYLLETLEWLNEEGRLNKTFLVIMSDQGAQRGELRNTFRGSVEARLPFMYFVVPTWFKKQYSRAFVNLRKNGERLVTSLDLYYTLSDLADMGGLDNNEVPNRELALLMKEQAGPLPQGISLFLPVPFSRTCQDAGIEENFCLCNKFESLSTRLEVVRQAGLYAIGVVNRRLVNNMLCTHLYLKEIRFAQRVIYPHITDEDSYIIHFQTLPGDGEFETVVKRNVRNPREWSIVGSVVRTNPNWNQSSCIEDNDGLKEFCYCVTNNAESGEDFYNT